MSSQRRFEGTDLEALLDEVRTSLGDDVHIVAANRVRKGGVGGFFAREYFEVVAEEPDTIDLRPAVRLGRRRRDEAVQQPVSMSRSVPRSVLDLVEERNAEERAIEHGDAVIGLAEYADDDPVIAAPSAALHHDVYVDDVYVDDVYVDDTHVDDALAPDTFVDVHLDTPRVSTETERFAQILERLAHSTEHRAVASAPAAAPAPAAVFPTIDRPVYTPSDLKPAASEPTVVAAAPSVTEPAHTAAPAPAPAPAEVAFTPPAPSGAEETIERPEHMLVRLGLPARYVPRGKSGDALRAALVESLDRLPRADALPETKGVVVAIVGIGARPVLLARSISEELGLDPDEVVVATETEIDGVPAWLQITEPGAADERRRSWRRRDQLTFVAISQPGLTASTAWASDMLDKLEPTQLWGLASAGWKPEDVDAWSRRLGGFDMLALDRLVDTVSPASMLTLGLPVGRLEGSFATPQRWTEILLERVANERQMART